MNRVAFGILDSVIPEGFHGLAVKEEGHRSHKAIGRNKSYQFFIRKSVELFFSRRL
jgi:hypothetical protein